LLAVSLTLIACDGGDDDAPTPTPTSRPSPTAPAATPAPASSDEPPPRDAIDLARRLRGVTDPPRSVQLPPPALGEEQPFELLILSGDSARPPERRTVTATLRAITEHAYLFVESGSGVPDGEVDDAARAFEEEVWPAVTGAFGGPPSPGVDGDPRVVLLHAALGPAVGGYVSGDDVYPRAVVPRSNQREMVYMNLAGRPLGQGAYVTTLAHEFQHLVHQRSDLDEEVWVNEGLSQVAAALLGGAGGVSSFLRRPDTQLNAWASGSGAHYAASTLFFAYLLEQTGGGSERLAAEPGDGIDGARAFLRDRGEPRPFEDLVADWAVANLLDLPDGPYGYRERDLESVATTAIDAAGATDTSVRQFAADYLELNAGDFAAPPTLVFEGAAETPALTAQDDARGAFWWSNRGDSIDSTLTCEVDLTGVQHATLTFRAWFDIERWFDYAYVVVSRDGGATWTALPGEHTTTDDPLRASYGPGYTGRSGGGAAPRWVDERIDLSAYAGQRILLRFEQVTDENLNEPGWAIDDIAVPEIGFLDDAEAENPGWTRWGFRRLTAPLRQSFELRLVKFGDAPSVEEVTLDANNRAEIAFSGLGGEYERAVVVVLGATEGTTEPARYRFEVR